MDPLIGQIVLFAGNFAPRGWSFCDGQLLQISQHTALFSILGTTYGGDGRTSFALPDLRGRVSVHPGNGPGLTSRALGEKGGAEQVTLTEQQMPGHTHAVDLTGTIKASGDMAVAKNPSTNVLATGIGPGTPGSDPGDTYGPANNLVDMDPASVSVTGTSDSSGNDEGHPNVPPFLGLHYIIALQGIYPSRN